MRLPVLLLALAACSVNGDTDPHDSDTDTEGPEGHVCGTPNFQNSYLKLDAEEGAAAIAAFCDAGFNGITGNLLVRDVPSLDGLDCLCAVEGNVQVSHAVLEHLDGLASLKLIGGQLEITDNAALTQVDGLGQLEVFDGDLTVGDNAALTHLHGLSTLQTAYAVRIENNPVLTDASLRALARSDTLLIIDSAVETLELPALTRIFGDWSLVGTSIETLSTPALTAVDGSIQFARNDGSLSAGGTNSPISLGGQLTIKENAALANLDHFPCVEAAPYNVLINENPALTTLDGLRCLEDVGGGIEVLSNPALKTLGAFDTVRTVASLTVARNSSLESADGLGALATIDGDLDWTNNGAASLDGMGNLSTIMGTVTVDANTPLTSVEALHSISYVGEDLVVTNNPALSSSATDALVEAIGDNVRGSVTVEGNGE